MWRFSVPKAIEPDTSNGLGVIRRVASFKPGVWNGKPYDAQFVRWLYANFQLYSAGPDPWFSPWVSINHKDDLRCGRVYDAELENDVLYLSCDRLLPPVVEWLQNHQLDERSVEFWEPTWMSGRRESFTDRDGKPVPTPVIRALTLLGADLPAVKGLGPLPPVTTFRQRAISVSRLNRVKVSTFSTRVTNMNPDLVNQLTSLRFDVSKLPPDTSDDVLQAIIDQLKTILGGTTTTDPNNPATTVPPVTMANNAVATGTAGATGTTGTATTTPAVPPGTPGAADLNKIVLHFNDQITGIVNRVQGQLNTIQAHANALNATTTARLNSDREGAINAFFSDMSKTGQITPAMQPPIRRALMKCDHVKVSRFSAKLADGRDQGTELDEAMNEYRTSLPVQRRQGSTAVVQNATGTGGNHVTGPGADGNGVRPEVVNTMLAATHAGRQALARQTAAAK